jgi:phosphoribosyl-ATP pyrophosphohydrolase/phosphoribosyl-AMP cyclohydrolase/histidinol dehydrogenase
MTPLLKRLEFDQLPALRRDPVDAATLAGAAAIVAAVRDGGLPALLEYARRFDGLADARELVRERAELHRALDALPREQRAVLERTAQRIHDFAAAQRAALAEISVPVPGGRAGHRLAPVERAGCYAPGGRFPLPSSVLMTAVTARAAGVPAVWVASPRPAPATLAAAALAGADALLAAGGAHAIAALAYGAGPVPACDAVVGPGNRWVTAAKQLVAGRVAIDMLAGPSELLVVADETADAGLVAADLLAQAEHDPDALPVLVTTSAALADRVEAELAAQLSTLPTAETARAALAQGFAVVVPALDDAVAAADRLAPEHLQLAMREPEALAPRFAHYGALFVGERAAEVLGDYGIGPNHTLPTGGTARFAGGLSVFTFLRVRTWLAVGGPDAGPAFREAVADGVALARIEGLEAHARAAERRL